MEVTKMGPTTGGGAEEGADDEAEAANVAADSDALESSAKAGGTRRVGVMGVGGAGLHCRAHQNGGGHANSTHLPIYNHACMPRHRRHDAW
jgi:hypothetical protein